MKFYITDSAEYPSTVKVENASLDMCRKVKSLVMKNLTAKRWISHTLRSDSKEALYFHVRLYSFCAQFELAKFR